MNTQSTRQTLNIDKLPSELIFEITKHLGPRDYISLYRTNKSLRDVLSYKPEYHKNMIRYLKNEFIHLSRDYLAFKDISVFDFDYFAENNDVGYDGKTDSFKKRYEYYARAHIYRNFKFNLNIYVTCLAANESFNGLSLNVKYDMDFALKFAEFACYNDETITEEAKEKLRKLVISIYLRKLHAHHVLEFMDCLDKFLYTTRSGFRYKTNRRVKFTINAMKCGRYAIFHYNALRSIKFIAIYLYGIAWPDDDSLEANYQKLRNIFDKAMERRAKKYKSSSSKFV